MKALNWPLMSGNVTRQDRLAASNFFLEGGQQDLSDTKLTNGPQVRAFEAEFASYIGTKYACMVNSGASANMVTMAALAHLYGRGKVLVPTIAWVSDVTSVLQAGLEPVFADVDPHTLGIDWEAPGEVVIAVFPTHVLGFNGLPPPGLDVPIIEDCCEALGAECDGRKLGSFGLASNFSFYYAHHLTTVEGGMICTDDRTFYETCRMLRAHGLLRECSDADYRGKMERASPELDPQFIFVMAGFNVRPTEVQAVLGRSQIKRLPENVRRRQDNLRLWLSLLDGDRYRVNYRIEGSSNYALPLILRKADGALMERVLGALREARVEYRRGTAGGGNQLRQPYLRKLYGNLHTEFPEAEYISDFGLYIGNFPDLEPDKIDSLAGILNAL